MEDKTYQMLSLILTTIAIVVAIVAASIYIYRSFRPLHPVPVTITSPVMINTPVPINPVPNPIPGKPGNANQGSFFGQEYDD